MAYNKYRIYKGLNTSGTELNVNTEIFSGTQWPKRKGHGIGWKRRRWKTTGFISISLDITIIYVSTLLISFVDRVDALKLSVYANAVLCLK